MVRCYACQQSVLVPPAAGGGRSPAPPPLPPGEGGIGLPPLTERDLRYERHIRAIAIWSTLGGLVMSLYALSTVLTYRSYYGPVGGTVDLIGLYYVLSLLLGLANVFVGVSLWRYRRWAHWTAIFLAGFSALLAVTGMSWGLNLLALPPVLWAAGVIWALTRPCAGTIFSEAYRDLVTQRHLEKVRWARSVFFWLPLALLLLGCGGLALFLSMVPLT